MASVLGSFGLVPFYCSSSRVLTYRDLRLSRSARWAEHQVFQQAPVKEFVGYNSDQVSFGMQIASSLGVNPTAAIELLTVAMDSHIAYPLIVAGDYLGMFVIDSFDVNYKHYAKAGICIYADINIRLSEA